ncbi:MAG: hypothetical protein QOD47_2659 [Gemmatimonadaceae bacterium]|jgi:hypothetical protein|nr:hypothetical protein [Gemmatimonadaceae bacterium]
MGALALAFVATTARAQVGHLPDNSPYRDLEASQEISFFGGRYTAGKDALGVAPGDGSMYGLRYEVHVGGPAFLMTRFAHVNSERLAIDPTKTGTAVQLGKRNVSLNLFDVNLVLNLTGQKSFHHIIPVINFGAGIANCSCTVSPDPYSFGTPFAFSFGGGLRYVPGGRFQLRADWGDYLYQLKYPAAYFLTPTNGTAVAGSTQAKSFWKNNRALTLGASLLFFR